jgi:hypothetical protein
MKYIILCASFYKNLEWVTFVLNLYSLYSKGWAIWIWNEDSVITCWVLRPFTHKGDSCVWTASAFRIYRYNHQLIQSFRGKVNSMFRINAFFEGGGGHSFQTHCYIALSSYNFCKRKRVSNNNTLKYKISELLVLNAVSSDNSRCCCNLTQSAWIWLWRACRLQWEETFCFVSSSFTMQAAPFSWNIHPGYKTVMHITSNRLQKRRAHPLTLISDAYPWTSKTQDQSPVSHYSTDEFINVIITGTSTYMFNKRNAFVWY